MVGDRPAAVPATVEAGPVGAPSRRADHGTTQGDDVQGDNEGDRQAGGPDDGADPQALHDLVVEHGDAVYRLALSIVRDNALAEDIAQDALVKAWLALPTLRSDTSLRSWVLRITHNTAISTLRSRRAVVVDPHELPEKSTNPERSVESRVQSGEVVNDFVDALDELDELSRSIVVLREVEDLSYEEIASVLKVPLPTVKTRLLRARRKLGSALREWT